MNTTIRVDDAGRQAPCREAVGSRNQNGYVRVSIDGVRYYAHRLALESKLGRPIRPGFYACHHCDNPPCVNEAHLFEGTPSDNQRDSSAKGRNARWTHPERTARGERNAAAKLTADQVREIRGRYRPGRHSPTNGSRLAAEYGVLKTSISMIVNGQTWTHLEGAA